MKKLLLFLLCSPLLAVGQVFLPAVGTHQFTPICTFSNKQVMPCPANLIWTSSAPTVVGVSTAGMSTGYSAGIAKIFASAAGVQSNTVAATVYPLLTSVTLAAAQTTIAVGIKTQILATCHYVGNVTTSCNKPDIYGNFVGLWAVKNGGSVAGIDGAGIVTGESVGAAEFAASSGLNSGVITITVH